MKFIKEKSDFDKNRDKYKSIFSGNLLPQMVLRDHYKYFLFSDFDTLFMQSFYNEWLGYLQMIKEDEFIFYVIDPDPEEYFYFHFGFYNILKGSIRSKYNSFKINVNADPGKSPADALIHNSNIVCIYPSNNKKTVIYGDREHEISIIGFQSLEERSLFLSVFNSIYLTSNIDIVIKELKSNTYKDESLPEEYDAFLETLKVNYLKID